MATGTGNTAFAVAGFTRHVTGLNVSPAMLAKARAEREGMGNVRFQEGAAEHLPFPDASFSLMTSRHAPHHFRSLEVFLSEARRVLNPGGRLVIADQITPESEHQAEMQTWVEHW